MKNLKIFTTLLLTFACTLIFEQTTAQTLPTNLATVKVDNLTDAQLNQYVQQAKAAGIPENNIVENAESRGLPAAEAQKLRVRLNSISAKNTATTDDGNTDGFSGGTRTTNFRSDTSNNTRRTPSAAARLNLFGADLFNGVNNTFEPNLRIATPQNYILGPDDQLNINVYGRSVVNWKLTVSPEGNINMPSGGVLNVAGQTIEQATSNIKSRLRAKNYAIGNGTDVKVTLGNIRSIKVIITGQVAKPGTYTLPSLATAFNALYSAGGPSENGSFREIEIIRSNRVIRKLDIYDFLVKGDQRNNIALQDQDIIRVPSYSTRVELSGGIKNPAIFELIRGETLQDLINFAGGFTVDAYTARIKVSQVTDQQRRITDILNSDFRKYIPQSGDRYTVDRILERYENRVTINGAVFRPGEFELQKGMTLLQLIEKAAGLKEDAFSGQGTITRLRSDNTSELLSFNVADVLNNKNNLPLQREDVVTIWSIFDLRDQHTVKISGEVRSPGNFAFAEGMKVTNLILLAGGLREGASSRRIEVARRVFNADPNSKSSSTAEIIRLDIDEDLRLQQSDLTLKPNDIVLVYSLPGYEKQRTVRIEGEVLYPGSYVIQAKNEKISDIVKRAGGITVNADVSGSTLKRKYIALMGAPEKADTAALIQDRTERLGQLKESFEDKADVNGQFRNSYIGIDLKEILASPGSVTDLEVKDGDVVSIPQFLQTVQVNGEVHLPSGIVYRNNNSFKDYIVNAGGYTNDALKRGAYVRYPNGSVKGTRKFLFFNNYPAVKPGSEIYIPKRPARKGFNTGEIIGFISALGTTAILAIISLRN